MARRERVMSQPEPIPSPSDSGPHVLRALRSRNYRLYFFGQGLSLIGTWMTYVATGWLVYRLGNSPMLLGLVGFSGQIPAFLLSPFAGVLVDRWNRHRVLVVTQILAMIQSFVMAILALTARVTIGEIIVLSIVQGLITGFDLPARQAFVIDIIERPEDMGNAIALNSSIFNGARLIGPSIAGILIAGAGEGVCFLVDAISYFAVIWAFCAMRLPEKPRSPQTRPLLRELREGLAYAVGFTPITSILSLTAFVSLVGVPYMVLMPVFAREVLHGGAHTLGFLTAASGLGALAGALYLASRKSILGLGRIITLATGLFGVSLIAFGMSRNLWVSLLLMLGVGFGMLVQMASGNTILQTIVDEDKRGRVMSFYAMAFMGMAPFGSLLAGGLAGSLGAPKTLLISGVGCLAAALMFARQLPGLREATRPIYIKKGIIPQMASGIQTAVNLLTPPEE